MDTISRNTANANPLHSRKASDFGDFFQTVQHTQNLAGAQVEIFSQNHKKWCRGEVKQVSAEGFVVQYKVGDDGYSEKTVPVNSQLIRPVRRSDAVGMVVGSRVVVKRNFRSKSVSRVTLTAGMKGTIANQDGAGALQVDFDTLSDKLWVFKSEVANLESERPVSYTNEDPVNLWDQIMEPFNNCVEPSKSFERLDTGKPEPQRSVQAPHLNRGQTDAINRDSRAGSRRQSREMAHSRRASESSPKRLFLGPPQPVGMSDNDDKIRELLEEFRKVAATQDRRLNNIRMQLTEVKRNKTGIIDSFNASMTELRRELPLMTVGVT